MLGLTLGLQRRPGGSTSGGATLQPLDFGTAAVTFANAALTFADTTYTP